MKAIRMVAGVDQRGYATLTVTHELTTREAELAALMHSVMQEMWPHITREEAANLVLAAEPDPDPTFLVWLWGEVEREEIEDG